MTEPTVAAGDQPYRPPTDSPDWFRWALDQPRESRVADVEGCPIHYLLWRGETEPADARGLLFVHGGGGHAHWWTFIAPFFARDIRVAAIDLSGMGDSGASGRYDAEARAQEMRAVVAHAGLGPRAYIVGHSFGGFMTMKFGALYGDETGGVVIVDSPIRSPELEAEARRQKRRRMVRRRIYDDFDSALERFRLMPEQPCANGFLVDYVGRHSLKKVPEGWTWKFDPEAMGTRRFGEPFHEYLQAVRCRAALIFGQQSRLVSRRTAAYMSELMGPNAPVVEIPEAQHHLTLDQPLAFVAALRTLLDTWNRS